MSLWDDKLAHAHRSGAFKTFDKHRKKMSSSSSVTPFRTQQYQNHNPWFDILTKPWLIIVDKSSNVVLKNDYIYPVY